MGEMDKAMNKTGKEKDRIMDKVNKMKETNKKIKERETKLVARKEAQKKQFCTKTMDKIENAMDKIDKHGNKTMKSPGDDKEGSGHHMDCICDHMDEMEGSGKPPKEGSGHSMENMDDKMATMDEKRSELEGKIKMEMDRAMNKTGN